MGKVQVHWGISDFVVRGQTGRGSFSSREMRESLAALAALGAVQELSVPPSLLA